MSYKSLILSDYPLSYYPLDDLTTVDQVLNFSDLVAQFDTYQDVLDYFSSYANISGDIIYDYSGCNNNGNYIGDPESNILPIVIGNSRSTKISSSNSLSFNIINDYAGNEYGSNFGTKYSSGSDFTLEAWIYPKISSNNSIPIFADSSNNIGLFYENGNITFKLDSKSLTHTLINFNEVIHVVGVYSVTSACIYINGEIVTSLSLSDFEFTNTECNLRSGPSPSGDYFLLNSLAIYRYSLPGNRVLAHYEEAKGLPPIQIAFPSNGDIFKVYDNSPSLVYKYSYPGNKTWDYFTTTDLYYDQSKNTLSVKYDSVGGSKNITIDDYITLPISMTMDSSKIEWRASEGITISTSLDGLTYTQCDNGYPIPGYEISNFSSSANLYIRINMSTTDASKYLPKIEDLIITFYNNQILYAENSSSYISTLEGVSGVSVYDVMFGNGYSEILWRNPKNGIRTVQDSGFYVNTTNGVSTLEFFYTPSALTDSGLINVTSTGDYSAATYYWHNSGTISKSNISDIYVNGVNKTSQTNVSNVFKSDELNHVIIVFGSAVSGQIKFADSTYGSPSSLFQNITLYSNAFTSDESVANYELYIYKEYSIINSSSTASINMTENSVNYYNNDWLVVQNS